MFDRSDATSDVSDRDGRAYFVEEDTGRICFLYRFPYGGESEYRRIRGNGIKSSAGAIFVMFAFFVLFVVADLYEVMDNETNITGNALLLIGAIVVVIFYGVLVQKKQYEYRFEDYQSTRRNHDPIYVEENKRKKILERVIRKKGRNMLLLFAMLLCITIRAGYLLIRTAEIEVLILPPFSVTLLLAFAPDIADRWRGWNRARKVYWSESLGRKEE